MGSIRNTEKTVEEVKAICRNQGIEESLWEKAAAAFNITIIDADQPTETARPSGPVAEWTDEQVMDQANRDRRESRGKHGMTLAMREEAARQTSGRQIYDA